MSKNKKKQISPIDQTLLGLVRDELVSDELGKKITMRILGAARQEAARLAVLSPDEIRTLRERANMSQAVFAHILNVSPGYVAQLEAGSKRPTGPALAMLHLIRRKGVSGDMIAVTADSSRRRLGVTGWQRLTPCLRAPHYAFCLQLPSISAVPSCSA
jgi:putative transcriptional regulator